MYRSHRRQARHSVASRRGIIKSFLSLTTIGKSIIDRHGRILGHETESAFRRPQAREILQEATVRQIFIHNMSLRP